MPNDLMPTRTYGFTVKHNGIAKVLKSETRISQAFDPTHTQTHPPAKLFNAIWDTGASGTVITKRVVDECGLKPIGMTKVHTASGERISSVYLVNIILRNNVGVPQIRVTEGILDGTADVLIGMDIITRGDFAVTNKNGKTAFSFRIPSIEFIDFVNKNQPARPPLKKSSPKIGRNAPCPCGSGKKYKKCCGKGK